MASVLVFMPAAMPTNSSVIMSCDEHGRHICTEAPSPSTFNRQMNSSCLGD